MDDAWRHGRPTVIAVDSDLPPGFARDAVARTDEVTEVLVGFFGPYPFEANGAIGDDGQDPVYALNFFGDWENTEVVAHEIAHQWFGDSIGTRHFMAWAPARRRRPGAGRPSRRGGWRSCWWP